MPELFEIIETCRAMRRLKPDQVPEPLIARILRAGTAAPSGGNTQKWRFLVITDRKIKEAVHKVREPKEVSRIGREVKKIEEEGDAVYTAAVAALFEGKPDALEVIKWKELFDNLEHALDEADDVLNVLESVSIKNS